jgi:hypothetical protein
VNPGQVPPVTTPLTNVRERVQDTDGVLTTSLLNNLALECMLRKEYGEAAALLS